MSVFAIHHRWFAWHPVRLVDTGKWVWLRRVSWWQPYEDGPCEYWIDPKDDAP